MALSSGAEMTTKTDVSMMSVEELSAILDNMDQEVSYVIIIILQI